MNQNIPTEKPPRDWSIFFSSVFFVLGFSLVFSLVGVLLQTVLSNVSYTVQEWLGRIGGVVIILFGFFMLGLFTPAFLKRDHKILVKKRFRSHYVTSLSLSARPLPWGGLRAFPRPWAPSWRLRQQQRQVPFSCFLPIRSVSEFRSFWSDSSPTRPKHLSIA